MPAKLSPYRVGKLSQEEADAMAKLAQEKNCSVSDLFRDAMSLPRLQNSQGKVASLIDPSRKKKKI